MNREPKTILGIDPGYGRMGYAALVDHGSGAFELQEAGCIETSPDDEHAHRLNEIAMRLRTIFEEHRPSHVIVERLLFTKNQTTGIAVAEARGVALAVAGAFGCTVSEVGPRQVKLAATGYGNADKRQVQEMVMRILKLDAVPQPDDAADACAIALSGK